MLANALFRDVFAHLGANGILPQSLATGTTTGTSIQLGGTAPFGKMLFRCLAGSGAATSMSMYLTTATVGNGTFVSISQTQVSAALTAASQYVLEIDTRMEAFANLATNAQFVKVVILLTGVPVPVALDILGWESGYDPAKTYDGAAVVVAETDFY